MLPRKSTRIDGATKPLLRQHWTRAQRECSAERYVIGSNAGKEGNGWYLARKQIWHLRGPRRHTCRPTDEGPTTLLPDPALFGNPNLPLPSAVRAVNGCRNLSPRATEREKETVRGQRDRQNLR